MLPSQGKGMYKRIGVAVTICRYKTLIVYSYVINIGYI